MRSPVLLGLLLCSLPLLAQAPAASSVPAPAPGAQQSMGSYSMAPVLADLDRLQSASSATDEIIGRLRVEKWKADTNSKRQAESNAESIQRNLRSALPGMMTSVRSAPQDVGAEFKLYRNVNALYDVMSSLTESTGAFGPKSDYDALAQQLDVIDGVRRSLGDQLEQLTVSSQSQLDQLRTQVRSLQAQVNTAPPPKKVVVDDTEPAKKTSTHAKRKPKLSTSDGGATTSTGTTSPAPPK